MEKKTGQGARARARVLVGCCCCCCCCCVWQTCVIIPDSGSGVVKWAFELPTTTRAQALPPWWSPTACPPADFPALPSASSPTPATTSALLDRPRHLRRVWLWLAARRPRRRLAARRPRWRPAARRPRRRRAVLVHRLVQVAAHLGHHGGATAWGAAPDRVPVERLLFQELQGFHVALWNAFILLELFIMCWVWLGFEVDGELLWRFLVALEQGLHKQKHALHQLGV